MSGGSEKFHDWELNHEHLLIVVHGYGGLGCTGFPCRCFVRFRFLSSMIYPSLVSMEETGSTQPRDSWAMWRPSVGE